MKLFFYESKIFKQKGDYLLKKILYFLQIFASQGELLQSCCKQQGPSRVLETNHILD